MDDPALLPTHAQTRIQWPWLIDCFAIALACFALFSVFLGSYPLLVPDEGRYVDVANHMAHTGNFITPFLNGIPFLDKPTFFYWMEALFIHVFGANQWAMRAWPMCVATLGCIITYLTGHTLYNRRTGWFAAIILASSLLYFAMAHIADMDLTVAVFIAAALMCFMMERYHVAYAFAGLAILTKGLIGIVLPMMIIGLWILCLNRWKQLKRMHIISGFLIMLAINLPWYALMQHANPDFLHYFVVVQQFERFTTSNHFNSRIGAWFYPTLILAGSLPWSVFFIAALIKKIRLIIHNRFRQSKNLFLLLWIFSITVFFSIPQSKTLGYILPVFPAVALITATYLDRNCSAFTNGARISTLLTGLLLVALAVSIDLLPEIDPKTHLATSYSEIHFIMAVCVIAATSLFVVHVRRNIKQVVGITACAAILLLLGFITAVAKHGTQVAIKTSKPLALYLKSHMQKNAYVVFFHAYYQDLPVYLPKQIILVGDKQRLIGSSIGSWKTDGWQHDFSEGLKDKKYQHLMLNDQQFIQLWKSKQPVYVLTTQYELARLENDIQHTPKIIKRYHRLVLVNNGAIK